LKRPIAKESGWRVQEYTNLYRNWSPSYAVAYRNSVKFLFSKYL